MDFKSIASADWATGPFGLGGGVRTPDLLDVSEMLLPAELHPNKLFLFFLKHFFDKLNQHM